MMDQSWAGTGETELDSTHTKRQKRGPSKRSLKLQPSGLEAPEYQEKSQMMRNLSHGTPMTTIETTTNIVTANRVTDRELMADRERLLN